jgi:hypothetical protein
MGFWKDLLEWMNNADVFFESYAIKIKEDDLEEFKKRLKEKRKDGIITISRFKEIK